MWTSTLRLRGQEFCSILNYAVRDDSVEMAIPLAKITRAINMLCVMLHVHVPVRVKDEGAC